MIKQIKITNFQSHTTSEIKFHPGINIICGESDVGKSSVVRAMSWISLNHPSGDGFRRHGTKTTEVEMGGVRKFRSASEHYYEMAGKRFKALRTDVPKEVADRLMLTHTNYQSQHSPYFLISDSPGAVAKALNAVGDLTIIDLSLKAARAKAREAATEGKFLKEKIKEKSDEIDALSWVVEADKDYEVIEDLEAEAAAVEVLSLGGIIATVETLQKKFDGLPSVESDIILINKALAALEVDETLAHVTAKVEENQVIIPETWVDLQAIESSLKSLEEDPVLLHAYEWAAAIKFEAEQFPAEIDDVTTLQENLIGVTYDCKEMEARFLEAFTAEDCLEEATAAHEQGKLEFNNKLKELGQCPLCGGGLDEDHISG